MKTWALFILGMLLIAWVISDISPSMTGFTQPRTIGCDSCDHENSPDQLVNLMRHHEA